MDRIVSFEDFRKKADQIAEEDHIETPEVKNEGSHKEEGEKQYYMFFQNLASIKHYIEEISKMNPDDVDALLRNGHDWAADHITSAKDDVQEVAEWIRNEMEDAENQGMDAGDDYEDELIEPENVEVEIEGNDDKVEVEGGEEKEDEDEDSEDEE